MFFAIKKIISALLMPASILAILLATGLLLLVFRCRKTAAVFFSLAFIGLLVCSLPFLPNALLDPLQSQYVMLKTLPNNIHTIVVLDGGIVQNPYSSTHARLSAATLSRLMEGIRLYRQASQATLVLSGGPVNSYSGAQLMAQEAIALGVKPSDIKIEDQSRDTKEEARFLVPLLGQQPFVLVTSAVHMPRSMFWFKAAGLHPIAAPTQFLATPQGHICDYIPNAGNIVLTQIAWHEYLGIAWAKL